MAHRYEMDEGFLRKNRDAVDRGIPVPVAIRDCRWVYWRKVRARIFSTPTGHSEPVRLRSDMGVLLPEPVYLEIVEDLPDDTPLTAGQS